MNVGVIISGNMECRLFWKIVLYMLRVMLGWIEYRVWLNFCIVEFLRFVLIVNGLNLVI